MLTFAALFVLHLFVMVIFLPLCSFAQVIDFSGDVTPDGVPSPWQLSVNAGRADIRTMTVSGRSVVRMHAAKSSFSLERNCAVSDKELGMVSWQWRADVLPADGDVRKAGRNDQVLQMMFAFADRSIISYVWDSNAPVGTVRDESLPWPISLRVKVLVVQSGGSNLGQWIIENRNISADYRKLFGADVPALRGIRVQTNSQHTKAVGVGFFGPIVILNESRSEHSPNNSFPLMAEN